MRYHDDRVAFFELSHQVLDLQGGSRIERAGRFVKQQDFWLDRQGSGDAKALLLAAGQVERVVLKTVFDLRPECGVLEAADHNLIQLAASPGTMDARPVGDVVVDRHRERVGLLKNHADLLAQQRHIDCRVVDVFAVDQHFAADANALDQIIHPVERF